MYTMVSKYLTITWCSPFTQIGKYLKKTATKGIALAFWPNGNHSFHAMRDTDLVRTWCKANANTRSSYLNRTGSVIMYSLIPIIWHYKVQTDVALSACKAEHTALSQCACLLIPLWCLIENIYGIYIPADGSLSLCNGPMRCLYFTSFAILHKPLCQNWLVFSHRYSVRRSVTAWPSSVSASRPLSHQLR